ncbi:MAG TPA: Trm112 family protein [Candidatus Lokiarchaeia archaeon]|nr:Trm112 family protein [Candidatus Lokiarchaeia archaeon]
MKPFLTEILACPIDKAFPLDIFIFQWEEPEPAVLEFFQSPTMELARAAFEKPLIDTAESDSGEFLASDQIVLGKKPFAEYLALVIEKIHELEVFRDTTEGLLVDVLACILGDIRDHVAQAISALEHNGSPQELFAELELDLTFLNAYKQRVEVEQGLLRCTQCQRWYPIVETIPQMLPDNLRNEKRELEFLTTWQDRLPEDIPTGGFPFHL